MRVEVYTIAVTNEGCGIHGHGSLDAVKPPGEHTKTVCQLQTKFEGSVAQHILLETSFAQIMQSFHSIHKSTAKSLAVTFLPLCVTPFFSSLCHFYIHPPPFITPLSQVPFISFTFVADIAFVPPPYNFHHAFAPQTAPQPRLTYPQAFLLPSQARYNVRITPRRATVSSHKSQRCLLSSSSSSSSSSTSSWPPASASGSR